MKRGEAEGEHKDGSPHPMFPADRKAALRCVTNLKSPSQAQTPRQIHRHFSQND